MQSVEHNQTVIAHSDYNAKSNGKFSFKKGDRINVLKSYEDGWWEGTLQKNNETGYFSIDYINIDHFTLNELCFCKKPLKVTDITKHIIKRCCCCFDKNKSNYASCGNRQCIYRAICSADYLVCDRCIIALNSSHSNDDDNNDNEFMMRKMKSMMNTISSKISSLAQDDDVLHYVFKIYDGLYTKWIVKLKDSAFGTSKQYKRILKEFDTFYGALLSQFMHKMPQSQKIVIANTDYKGMISNELSFNKNDEIVVLFELYNYIIFGKLKKTGIKGMLYSKCINRVVIARSDYIAKKDVELSFKKGDKIVVLKKRDRGWWKGTLKNQESGYFSINYIHIDHFRLNQLCFCMKPLKVYKKTKNIIKRCHCCFQEYKSNYACCGDGDCKYCIICNNTYLVCTQCFNDDDHKYDDNHDINNLMLRKMKATMNTIKSKISSLPSDGNVQSYIFNIYDGLYTKWIVKLKDSAFGASEEYKRILEEFDTFYSALLSQFMHKMTPSQRIVVANCDYKATIDSELTFNKNDKINILFENDNGIMFGKLDENRKNGMLSIDYINIDNINQICFCTKPLKKISEKRTLCNCCCKEYPQKDITFYNCLHRECEYNQISTLSYCVCYLCFNTENKENEEENDDFKMKKVKATIQIMNHEIQQYKDKEQRKKYMSRIRWIMYTLWIRKLNDHKIEQEFNAFYDKHLERIAKEIDENELELKEELMPKRHTPSNIEFNKISLEWICLREENEEKEAEFEDICHGDVAECSVGNRIKFIMNIYKKHFLSKYIYDKKDKNKNDGNLNIEFVDIFMHSLSDYDGIKLMNDSQHYRMYHFNENKLQNCDIKKIEEYDEYLCCKALLKQQRDSNYTIHQSNLFSVYCNKIDYKQLNIIQIASNLHQMINHELKSEEKHNEMTINTVKMRALKWSKKDRKHSKFMNKMIAENKKNDTPPIDTICNVLITNGASNKECVILMTEIKDKDYDSDSIHYDSIIHNQYNDSNLFSVLNKNKKLMIIIRNHFKNKISRFDLGKIVLKHWSHFKDGDEYIKKPKYATLKEESLHNNIHHITLETFNRSLNKAFMSAFSSEGRALKAQDFSADNNIYSIPPNLPVTVSHILVLQFYCNNSELQRIYKEKGCRELYVDEGVEPLKARNREIAHWYRLLYEAVMFYGSAATANSAYYTGISVPVSFDSFVAEFRCPISTTISQSVALHFSKDEGIVLKMIPAQNSLDSCFNVEWLSDYRNESERLFFQADRLKIEDIQYFVGSEARYNTDCVTAFRLWSYLFYGEFFSVHLRGKQRERTQETLLNLIRKNAQNNGIEVDNADNVENVYIDTYLQQIFDHLLQRIDNDDIYLIQSEFNVLNDSLKKQLLSFESESSDVNNNPRIRSLSPFLGSLMNVSRIRILTEFSWRLSQQHVEDLRNGQKDKYIMSESSYDYKLKNNETITFKMGIINKSDNEYTVFILKIKKLSIESTSGVFSIAINDLNWTLNRQPFYNLSENKSTKPYFFKDKLLNKVESFELRIAVFFE